MSRKASSFIFALIFFSVHFQNFCELRFSNSDTAFGIYNGFNTTSPRISRNATFIIGGLFAIHFAAKNPSDSRKCVGRWNGRGFEEAKAMLYAIEKINKDANLLPGIKLGADIKDTCDSIDFAIRSSLNFSFIDKNIQVTKCPLVKSRATPDTIAIIGPGTSDIAMAVTNLAGLFHIPIVDYSSTSRLLNNRIRFKYFLRTVSSDVLLSKAIVDLLVKLGWNYIHVLYSDTDYGRSAFETFEFVLTKTSHITKICKATKGLFNIYSSKKHLEQIVKDIKSEKRAKGVVLLTTIQDTELILNKFNEKNMNDYVFISPDYFSGSIKQFNCSPQMLRRVIGIVPHTSEGVSIHNISEEFSSKYLNNSKQISVWEEESKRETTRYCHSLFVPYVIDAVYAIAHGLHNMLNCSTTTYGCTNAAERFADLNRNGDNFLKSIQSVRFKGLTRDPMTFNKYGDSDGTYDINIVNPLTDQWMKFGSWTSTSSDIDETVAGNSSVLKINERILQRVWNITYFKTGIPESVCGRKCPPGHWMRNEEQNQICCWKCEPCTGSYISNTPVNASCTKCPRRYWPNTNHSSCQPITPTSVHITDTPGIVVAIATTLGSITVIAVAMVFFWYGDTHIVRSSSKRLSYVMFSGILLGYVTSLVLLFEKSEMLCRCVLFSFSISFSIIVGTLLTKTNRIHRIFSKKAMRNGTPPCLSDNWMLLFIAGFVSIEVIICVVIVMTSSGTLMETIYSDESNEAFVQCKFTATYANYNMAIWWTYNTGIVLVCTYQAYLTRKVPGSHNEARFIAFTMITISTDVLVFFLSFYGTQGYYKDILVSTFLIIAVTVTLCCVFLPKVYVILLKPEKNVDLNPVRSMGTIEHSDTEMRKISHMSQRSCTSYLSSSSTASAPENSKFIPENNTEGNATPPRRIRKMSVFVKNGIYLNSSEDILNGRESGPNSMETMLEDDEHGVDVVSSTRGKVSRMLSDMSVKSVHFEDENEPGAIVEEFDPSYLDNYEYRRRKSTI